MTQRQRGFYRLLHACPGCGITGRPSCRECKYCERCHAYGRDYIARAYGEHEWNDATEPTPLPAWAKPQWDTVQQLRAQTLYLQKRFYDLEKMVEKVSGRWGDSF